VRTEMGFFSGSGGFIFKPLQPLRYKNSGVINKKAKCRRKFSIAFVTICLALAHNRKL